MTYAQKKKMSQWPIFALGRWRGGVLFEKKEKRFYPFGNLAARTIGFINQNEQGVGLEYTFHKTLKGIPGKGNFQKIVGNYLKKTGHQLQRPQSGHDIITTLNIHWQDHVHDIMYKALQKHQASYGCAVVMEVRTGAIKAIVNLGKVAQGYQENYNYAWGEQGNRDPGSTFKLATMMAVLEASKLPLDTAINTGKGRKKFYDRWMKDVKPGGYGYLTVQEIFEKSSNIGIALLAEKYFKKNPQQLLDYLRRFGLKTPLNMHMDGIAHPKIKNMQDKSWSGITLPWMSIGYEIELTPLHILSLYNAVANDGRWVHPYLVEGMKQGKKTVHLPKPKASKKRICSQETLKKIQTMLVGVIQRGTARNLRNSFYTIAGKSGTSQRIEQGRYTQSWYTSFVGYFPAENPQYSCIVCIDNPQGPQRYGSNVAAPVFQAIAHQIAVQDVRRLMEPPLATEHLHTFPYIQVGKKKDLMFLCQQWKIPSVENNHLSADIWVRAKIQHGKIHWKKEDLFSSKRVPRVVGMTLKDALYILENRKLKVKFQGKGRVYQQSLSPGTLIRSSQFITLLLK